MTHAELTRKRALRSVETFIAALEDYKKQEFHPKDRGMFKKRDGIFRIVDSPTLPPGILEDTESLREALKNGDPSGVNAVLKRLFEADHDIPYDTKTDYQGLHVESYNRSCEYVELSSLDLEDDGSDGTSKTKRPAWDRLKLNRSSDGSDHIAELDGKRIRIRGDAALKMLDILQKKKGERVKGLVLQKEIGRRPNIVLDGLAKPLQRIIDPPKRGIGYAML